MGMDAQSQCVAADGTPLDDDLAKRIAFAMAKKQIGLFSAFRAEVDIEDLAGEAIAGIVKAWPKYNAAKAKPSTYITRVAHCTIIDLYRKLSCRHRNDKQIEYRSEVVPDEHSERLPDENLLTFTTHVHRNVNELLSARGITARSRFSRKTTASRAQQCTLLILKRRLKQSSRGFAMLLSDRPEILKAIGAKRSPSHMTINRLEKTVTHLGIHLPKLAA